MNPLTITFSTESGEDLGTIRVSPTGVDIPPSLWWLINKIFPSGVFPYLDPSDTFMQFRKLPHRISVPLLGSLLVHKL